MERQTNFSKRIFSIILSLLMVLSMMLYFPGSVFNELSASADSLVRASFNGFEITASTSGYLEALNKTINDSSSNLTNFIVTLENDITMENSMVIPEGKNVIINLDGHKLSYGEGSAFSVSGNLTINGSGTITSGNKDSLCGGAWIHDGGTLNVNNASFMSCIGTTVFNINQGGTVNMNSGSRIGAHICPKDSVLPLLQGTVVNSGTFNMNDSANLAPSRNNSTGIEMVECCGLYNTSGGVFNANGGVIESKVKNEGTITRTVTDSTTQFNDEVSNLESGIVEAGNYNGYFMNNGTVKGGNFTNAISGLYRVTFYKDGGILETQYRAKAPITVPTEPTKAGYKFTGWYNNGTKWDTSADVTSDMILNAGWEDTEAPIISGIVNNGKYCLSASFTVSDNVGVASVTSNGNAVPSAGGKYTLSPASGVQSVVVKDKAGNTTTYSVTVNEKHTYNNSGSCSVCSVKDTTAPVISGIENNKTYCLSAEFTVSDNHQVDSVTINGKTVSASDGKYTISPASGVQSVVVKDKAGNTTTYKVTVNANHSFNDSGICTNCNVADKEKPVLSGVVNKGVYCLSAEFTVSDNHKVDSVEINGEPAEAVNGKYTLSPATGKQSIIITDIAGNIAIYYVTVNAQHSDGEGGMCSVCGNDNTAPVFSGIADGESYCESSQFSVSDNVGVVSVTLNGKEITPDSNGNYIISSSGEHKIIAKDAEGNTVSCTITIQNHLYSANGFCTACDVYEPADKNSKGEYEIGNAGQLYWFADKVNNDNANYGSENAVLTADIVVNTGDVANCNGVKGDGWIDWTPIGNDSNKYTGIFDGQNHTISGLYFNDSDTSYVGLFGCINGCTIQNVGILDSYFKGYMFVGGVCGMNENCTIINCYNTGKVSGTDFIGGVCGNNSGTIKNCYNTGEVSGSDNNVGGVCGNNNSSIIENCYFDSTVYNGDAVGTDEKGTVSENVLGKTTAQFNSGEVAYLLSQGENGSVWGQIIGKDNYPVLGGKKVLANVDQSAFANDIIVYGQSASLDGTIGFNIYVSADDSYEWNKTISGVTGVKNDDGLYVFTYNLAAKDMDKKIKFTVNDKIDITVSVSDYLAELSKTDNESLRNLADSMSNYGDAAKSFFSGGTVAEQTVTDDLSSYDFTIGTKPEGIIYYGSSLILESETTIRHYFKLAEGRDISEYTISVDSMELAPSDSVDSMKLTAVEKQGYYYIEIQNISAEKLGMPFNIIINGEKVITNYSVLSYVNKVLESDSIDDNLKNLVKALYIYNQNALAYIAIA